MMFTDLSTQKKIEKAYKDFADIFDKARTNLSSLTTTNIRFKPIQQNYKQQLESIINNIQVQLKDVQQNAIWDKLVIAFIGVTNAGKSTIIETFRILFDEPERLAALKQIPSGVDGAIIGDGRADFTRVYKEYNMSIGGKPFVLIDVPGIEGNEGAVKKEIMKALGKAHCVFYVQGEGKKPDSETVKKIKSYLKDWVKVYSIYNVKGTAFNYDEEDERSQFKTDSICKVEQQIVDTMAKALGSNYAGNITIQARLALCAIAKFANARQDLQQEQDELLKYFGSPDKLFAFSSFNDIVKNVDHLASHFTDEILEAQRKKLFKLHVGAINSLDKANKANIAEIDRIISKFQTCKRNIYNYFSSSLSLIKSKIRQEITEMFDIIENNGCYYIDMGYGGEELKNAIEREQRQTVNDVEYNIDVIINNELADLRKNINKEILKLRENFRFSNINSKFTTSFNIDLGNVLDQLNFNFGDLMNWGTCLGSGFMLGWTIAAGANWWNPVGWGLAALGALITILSDSKEDKAKAKLQESISDAKNDVFSIEWPNMTREIDSQFKNKINLFDRQMNSIIDDFKAIKIQMSAIVNHVKFSSLKFGFSIRY